MPTTHVVLVSWREGAAEEGERTIHPAIAAFSSTIPGLLGVVERRSTSVEGLEAGFDYGFVLTFASAPPPAGERLTRFGPRTRDPEWAG